MLVLARKRNGQIIVGDNIIITILAIKGDVVRLGIEAPDEVRVDRREVRDRIERGDPFNGRD